MFNRLYLIISCLILACTMGSCEYKDLDEVEFTQSSVTLDFSWENVDSIPRSFRVLFYPVLDGTETYVPEIRVFDIYNSKALLRNVVPGKYRVSAFNTDTEHVKINGYNNRKSLEATTPPYFSIGIGETTSLDSLFYNQTILDTPDYLLHANEEMFEVKRGEEEQLLILHPDSMVVSVNCKVKKFKGLEHVKEVRGVISNVARNRFVAYDNLTRDSATVMFNCRVNETDSMVYSNFYLYGVQPHEMKKAEHVLTLLFWLDDRNVYFRIPITEIIAAYTRDDRYVVIDIDDVEINLVEKSSVGSFEIEINEWEDIHIDIPW